MVQLLLLSQNQFGFSTIVTAKHIAMRTNDTLTWLLSDHQPLGASRGLTSLITDAGGATIPPDTIIPQPGSSLVWDRYAYVQLESGQ